jgi:cytochrome P450
MSVEANIESVDSLESQVDRLFRCDPEALRDPFPIYRRLRQESPVLRYGPMVVLSRFDDIEMCFDDDTRFSNVQDRTSTRVRATAAQLPPDERELFLDLVDFESLMMFVSDPPSHTLLRGLANKTFTARRVLTMREGVQDMTSTMLDRVGPDGHIELLGGLAYELPLFVVSDLLGVPVADRPQIRAWSESFASFIGNYSDIAHAHSDLAKWRVYMKTMIAEQQREPTTPLVAGLLAATDDGRHLSIDQVESTLVNLLFGGHETTTNLLCLGLATLAQHPDQYKALREDPALLPGAVEELARHSTSVHTIHRVAKEDLEIRGEKIDAGQTIRLLLASGNRDEDHFEEPERFDIFRKPLRNVTFGRGIHFCIGAALARMEISVVLEEFIRRYERIELLGEPVLRPNVGLRGPDAVHLRLVSGRSEAT